MRASATLVKLLTYSVSLYRQLRVDGAPGFWETGSLRLASSKQRWEEVKRLAGVAKVSGWRLNSSIPPKQRNIFR